MSRAVKINITLPEEALREIDRFAEEQSISRSGLILQALRSYIDMIVGQENEKRRRAAIQKASSDIREMRSKSGHWDGVSEIRKWREAR